MCDIPLDLQRKFEERWAARFVRPGPPRAPKEQDLEGQDQRLSATVSVVPPDTPLTKCAGGPPNFIKKVSRLPSPHAWGRPMLIGLAVFALWLVISVATYQESPEDTPIIVSLLSK